MSKYRFKTEEEFIIEFGFNWKRAINWPENKDHFLGQEILKRDYEFIQMYGYGHCTDEKPTFEVTTDMVKKEMDDILIIRGYKAPTDLFNGKIKKGTVFIDKCFNPDCFKPDGVGSEVKYNLPKEIVRSWEPVHHHFKIGDWVWLGNKEALGVIKKFPKDIEESKVVIVDVKVISCHSMIDITIWDLDYVSKATSDEITRVKNDFYIKKINFNGILLTIDFKKELISFIDDNKKLKELNFNVFYDLFERIRTIDRYTKSRIGHNLKLTLGHVNIEMSELYKLYDIINNKNTYEILSRF